SGGEAGADREPASRHRVAVPNRGGDRPGHHRPGRDPAAAVRVRRGRSANRGPPTRPVAAAVPPLSYWTTAPVDGRLPLTRWAPTAVVAAAVARVAAVTLVAAATRRSWRGPVR